MGPTPLAGHGGFVDYLFEIGNMVVGAIGWTGAAAALIAIVYLLLQGPRLQWFALGTLVIVLLPILIARPANFPRYTSPLLPGLALLCGVALASFNARIQHRYAGWFLTALALSALSVSALIAVTNEVGRSKLEQARVRSRPHLDMAAAMSNGDAVLGVRATELNWVTTRIQPYGYQVLPEKDLVTYLTWPSDERLLRVFQKHSIDWVFIHQRRMFEVEYNNTWLEPAYGLRARHVEAVSRSSILCPVVIERGYELHKVAPC
jgi:hypothetical protein